MSIHAPSGARVALALSCAISLCGLASCSAPPADVPTGQISAATVYDKQFSIAIPVMEPQSVMKQDVNITLLGSSASKTVPDAVPNGALRLDPDDERVNGYGAGDNGTLSDGFHYVSIHLSISNPSDKNLVIFYNMGSIVSGSDAIDHDSSIAGVSMEPVWYTLIVGKEGTPNAYEGILKPHQTQDTTIVYVVNDKLLNAGDGPYLVIDTAIATKAFKLDLASGDVSP